MDLAESKRWRVIDVLKWSTDYLRQKEVASPQVETEWMLRDILGYSRLDLYLHYDRPMSAKELNSFKKFLLQRSAGNPIQYILGYTEFMGYRIKVSPAVLIPRPETEMLVERAMQLLPPKNSQRVSICDIGTGSGNIAIALAANFKEAVILALDISSKALAMARQNARANNVLDRISFKQVDILSELPDQNYPFDLIISNPPYVGGEWFSKLPDLVKQHEPREALYPGEDDLIFYRRIVKIAAQFLKNSGLLVLEIGGTYQAASVKDILLNNNLQLLEVIVDYQKQSRGIVATGVK